MPLVLALCAMTCACLAADAPMMDNWKVYQLVKQGVPTETIISAIRGSEPRFDLRAEEIAKLRNNGVPESVLEAMALRQSPKPESRKTTFDNAAVHDSSSEASGLRVPFAGTRTFDAHLLRNKERTEGKLYVSAEELRFGDLRIRHLAFPMLSTNERRSLATVPGCCLPGRFCSANRRSII
jgi:hypothetical protein